MSRSTRKSSAAPVAKPSAIAIRALGSILEQLPDLSDEELANLKSNAERLVGVGSPRHASVAAEVLPAISRELVVRLERRGAARSGARTKSPVTRKLAPVAPVVIGAAIPE